MDLLHNIELGDTVLSHNAEYRYCQQQVGVVTVF